MKKKEKKKKVEDKKKGMEKDKKRWRKINETRGSCNCRLSLSRYLLLSSSDHARKDKEERKKRRRIEKEQQKKEKIRKLRKKEWKKWKQIKRRRNDGRYEERERDREEKIMEN